MKKITRETLNKFNYVSSPILSPESGYLAYRQTKAATESNKYTSHIRIFKTATSVDYRLTSDDIGGTMRFLNEDTLTFIADRESHKPKHDFLPESKLYRISLRGGEAELFLTLPCGLEDYYFINENELLLQVLETPEGRAWQGLNGEEKTKQAQALREAEAYEVLEEAPFWSNGKSYNSGHRSRIYHYWIDKEKFVAISAELQSSKIMDFDLRSKRVLFVSENKHGLLELSNQLFVYDISTKETRAIGLDKPCSFQHATFVGEDIICVASDMEGYGLNEDGAAYLLKKDAVKADLISRDIYVGNSVGTDVQLASGTEFKGVKEGVYFSSTEGTSSYLKFMDRQGVIKTVVAREGSVSAIALCTSAVGETTVYICAMRGQAAPELYRVCGDSEERISLANSWLAEYRLAATESFALDCEGARLKGFVIKPTDYEAGKKYPAILSIHGGPKTVYGEVLHHEMQMLAAQGYFVFYTNPHGSDGFGSAWADLRGRYGKIDYQQLMCFTDAVLERYHDIDAEKLGVMGGSYGGFMCNWIIGHTNRFKAACTQRSISNWFSMYGISDIGYYFTSDQTAADPWTSPEKLWEQSPLKYAEQIKTPTLIIHSDEDYRCPLAEGQQLFTALKVHGVESRMVIFKGENHELSRSGKPLHRQRRLKEIGAWFAKYLQ